MKNQTCIPWEPHNEWRQVFFSIQKIDAVHSRKLNLIRERAQKIRDAYLKISEPLDTVCSHTCVACKDICCKRATIWFDLKDLLYLYFGMDTFPEKQIFKRKGKHGTVCCYFSENGCSLDRVNRPFVCTWYFCFEQKQYMMCNDARKKQLIDRSVVEIKDLRNLVEEEFIRVSTEY